MEAFDQKDNWRLVNGYHEWFLKVKLEEWVLRCWKTSGSAVNLAFMALIWVMGIAIQFDGKRAAYSKVHTPMHYYCY